MEVFNEISEIFMMLQDDELLRMVVSSLLAQLVFLTSLVVALSKL